MRVWLMKEFGYEEALFGLGLSYGKVSGYATPEEAMQHDGWSRLCELATELALYGAGGHDKFLRQIGVILDITAPLYWWKQMDTYKVGTVAQSESTMHTLLKNPVTKDCFESGKVPDFYINFLEYLRQDEDFVKLNAWLPQSWLQRRIWTGNYAVLKNIILQRENHKLPEWKFFFDALLPTLGHPELLPVRHPLSQADTTAKASAEDETLSGKG
jgi:hypothetical protein